ncbi:MAG TPA: PrgI family protein [Candidatus Dormibacteraeota bacterium]|nr:PrgI family protein [Candidatus Dormibacteraeota bacterium]
MMQAEVPLPISGVPLRWGGFTARQLGWLGVGAALPYFLLRLQIPPELALGSSAPWLGSALLFAFGRREGRQLDLWVGDWLWFKVQPQRLRHPGLQSAAGGTGGYVAVDEEVPTAQLELAPPASSLPWIVPWS